MKTSMKIKMNTDIFKLLVKAIFATSVIMTIVVVLVLSVLDSGFAGWLFIIVPFIFLYITVHSIIGSLFFLLMIKYQKNNLFWIIILGAFVSIFPGFMFAYLKNNTIPVSNLNDMSALLQLGIGNWGNCRSNFI